MGTETWENGIANMGGEMGEWECMSECEKEYRSKTWAYEIKANMRAWMI